MATLPVYSIWLMPSGKIFDDLNKLITLLGHQFGGPVFPPHLTLLGELRGNEKELSFQVSQLAASICSFQITLTTVDYLDAYFRCLFLHTEETPSLLTANQEARAIFHREE